MNIEMPHSGRIEFRLDSDDLSRLNITFDELDYANAETRRVVWTLIDLARQNLQVDLDLTGRLLVEVFPERSGGCRLCITTLPRQERSIVATIKPSITTHMFEFSLDELLDFTQQIKKLPVTLNDGELFSDCEKYRLILPLAENQHSLHALICEYAVYKGSDEITLRLTREHWKPLGNALKSLGS